MAKERKVVYSLEVVEGQGNAKAFANTEAGIRAATAALKEHSAAQRELDRNTADRKRRATTAGGGASRGSFSDGMDFASAREIKTELDAGVRAMLDHAEREKKILRDRVRTHVEANRAITQAARQANADGWKRRQAAGMVPGSAFEPLDSFSDADAKRAVNEMGRAHTLAEREAIKHHAQQMRVLGGYVQIGHGAMQAARAAIFFGATNEDNSQKMLKMVLIGESLVSTFTAARDIAAGLGKVLGAGGIGGGALRGLLAGGGLAGGAAFAGKAAGIAVATGAGIIGLDALQSYRRGGNVTADLRDGARAVSDWTGLTDNVGDHRRAWSASLTNAENRTMGDKLRPQLSRLQQFHRGGLDRAEDLAGLLAGGPSPAAQLAAVQAKQSLAQKELDRAGTRWKLPELQGADGAIVREGVARRELEASERMLRLTAERHQIEVAINRDSISASQQRIRNLEQERDARRAMMAEAAGERRSGAAAFYEKSPVQRALALSGVRNAQAGKDVSDAEAREMEGLGGVAASFVDARREQLGLKSGYNEIAAWNNRDPNMIAKGVQSLTAKINTEATLKVSLEMNEAQLVDKFKLAIAPLFDLIEVRSRQLFGLEEQVNQMRRAQEIRQFSEDQGSFR